MFLHYLWCHIERSSTNSFVYLTFILKLFRETKISDFELKPCLGKVYFSEELFPLVLIHLHELLGMIWEMHHNILKL